MIIGYIGTLPLALGFGVIYDVYGRRKPLLATWALAAVAFALYPLATNEYLFYLVNLCIVPMTATSGLPIIPDLIKEEGQPVAILFATLFKCFAFLINNIVL